MRQTKNSALAVAAVFGFTGVALGAFGAHGLQSSLSAEALGWWHTGVEYHLVHAVVLVAIALGLRPSRSRTLAWGALSLGVVLFSGSLYVLALSGQRAWGAVTPVGGVLFLVGWVSLGWAGWKAPLYKDPGDR